jgi:hypothetical protein
MRVLPSSSNTKACVRTQFNLTNLSSIMKLIKYCLYKVSFEMSSTLKIQSIKSTFRRGRNVRGSIEFAVEQTNFHAEYLD